MKRIYLQNSKKQIARPTTIRDINKRIVLNYVRDRSPISRADIARETDLQRSTVSAIVDDLQKELLIEEIGTGDSTGGRKPTLLKLKTEVPVAVGIDVTPRKTTIAVADLSGEVLEKESFATSPDMDFMNNQIIQRVEKIGESFPESNFDVGISVPGIADQKTGLAKFIPYFQWVDWDIARQIENKFGYSVTIDNDANAIALAELWFGQEEIRKTSNFITILVAEGIGTGIIFEGQIYRGENGAAGEFGHMIVGGDAPPVKCSCGSDSCWEAQASEKATLARYKNSLKRNNMFSGDLNFSELVNLAKNGEELANDVIKQTAKYLGIGISNLIVGFSPRNVIVSGAITKCWDLIADEIYQISKRSVRNDLPESTIIASTLGDSPTLTGSLSLVIARKFASVG